MGRAVSIGSVLRYIKWMQTDAMRVRYNEEGPRLRITHGQPFLSSSSPNVRTKVAIIVCSIVLISCAHYLTSLHLHLYHEVYQALYYLPIFSAALWFGIKGGLGASVASSVLYVPHIVFQWKILPSMELEKYLAIVLFNVAGALTGILAERANRQSELYRRTSEKLERAYHELDKTSSHLLYLENKLRQAEKISALGELSATVAHELMNPLGSIKGAVEILKDEFPDDHEKHAFLKILIKEIERLDRTVRGILRFGVQYPLSKTLCNPNELIESILVLVRAEAIHRGIRIVRKLSPYVQRMYLDPDKIQQVFLNIIMNAVQAMPDGGVFTVASEWRQHPPADMESPKVSEGLLITFTDTGVGIPDETKEQVFEPLYTTRAEGTGLGLAIAKRIVVAHGGTISVQSSLGAGARFNVWLPASEST